jgi:hypothetical protein
VGLSLPHFVDQFLPELILQFIQLPLQLALLRLRAHAL